MLMIGFYIYISEDSDNKILFEGLKKLMGDRTIWSYIAFFAQKLFIAKVIAYWIQSW